VPETPGRVNASGNKTPSSFFRHAENGITCSPRIGVMLRLKMKTEMKTEIKRRNNLKPVKQDIRKTSK
jgi:hypothetical protein